MDRLSLVLSLLTGAVLTGALTILAFNFGWYGWIPILGAAIIGFGLAWPLAYWISRRIKREDPHFDGTKAKKVETPAPDPRSKEV